MTFSAGGLACLITHSTYTRSATSRPFWRRQKPDTTLNFISPRHMIWSGKKRKITDKAHHPYAGLLSLSHSRFLSCHSLLADFCEPSLSWSFDKWGSPALMVITLTIKQAGYCISKHWKDLQPKVAQEMFRAIRDSSQKLHLNKSCF